ncbi:hypothetical protein [Streptomyces sp. NPDC002990]
MKKITTLNAPFRAAITRRTQSRFRRLATAMTVLGALVLPLAGAVPAHAVTRKVHVAYQHTHYEVDFIGTVKPKGATGYILDGDLSAWCGAGALTHQSFILYYRGASQSWQYKSFWCDDSPQHLHLEETRASGEKVELQVGATSGIANTYGYGKKMVYDIGTS